MFREPLAREQIDKSLAGWQRALLSVVPILPRQRDLEQELSDARQAEVRGYFLPDEDERVRAAFARYLTARAVLHETVKELKPLFRGGAGISRDTQLRAFAIGACAACMLLRAGRFMIDSFADMDVIMAKLDEAEPRYGIPAGQFTRVYRSLVHPANLIRFVRALHYADLHRAELEALADDPEMTGIMHLLAEEQAYLETSATRIGGRILNYRVHSLRRRPTLRFKQVMFGLFKISGCAIAEMRNPWKRKRVTPRVRRRIATLLRPGDIVVTRHDDAMSNLFLPGFWPHSALYIGSLEERTELGVTCDEARAARSGGEIRVLEARKDGVLFRSIDELLAVDCFTVIRPRLEPEPMARALSRALTHEGKPYDFEFDFRRSDCMVCTEVVYRTYHGEKPISFTLTERAGRLCLSAEDLLNHAVDRDDFEVVAVYGVGKNRLVKGAEAREILIKSYRREAGRRAAAGSNSSV